MEGVSRTSEDKCEVSEFEPLGSIYRDDRCSRQALG